MKKTCLTVLLLFMAAVSLEAQWLWNRQKMDAIKASLHSFTYAPAYRKLIADADRAVARNKHYSVTFKQGTAPSGDKHDYVSLGRYWWPNPDAPDGMPYIHKDGESNPELAKYDRNALGDMCADVNTLALAYYYSGEEKYAMKAVDLLKTWFLDIETRMNPHLEYAQFVPGRNKSKGRPEGLIDSYSFVEMLSSVQLLTPSASYTTIIDAGLRKWFADFASWLQRSDQGKKERRAKNNHGTAYDAQLITYLLFAGDETGARHVITEFPSKRIFPQIEPDGRQPNELWRTLAYHYSWYNLSHMLDVSATAQKLGINMLERKSGDGRSISAAVDYLASFLGKERNSWPYKQISGWEQKQQDVCVALLRLSSIDSSKAAYRDMYHRHARLDINSRERLLYGADDPIDSFFAFAASQLDYAMTRIDSAQKTGSHKHIMPRSVDEQGKLVLVSSRDWCSGFFPGSLWMMYNYTKDDRWRTAADRYTRMLEGEKNDRSTHDVGFKINCSYGNGFLMTKDSAYKDVLVQAASTLSKRFHPKVGAIRSWDFNRQVWQFPVIIDNMMNLELLFEVSRLSGDDRLYHIADTHAETTLKNHFRPDFSSFHVIDYDTVSSHIRHRNTHQGYADGSAWARGQAWALYGYTMSYRYTRKPSYLKQAEGVAAFMLGHKNLPEDMVPYWDYDDPAIPNAPRDASAAAITASALYELAAYSADQQRYIAIADDIVASLLQHYRATSGADEGFLLLHATGHYPHHSEIDVPISYADYYFLEALIRRKALDKR
jgi:unsaturated chondroitin disaccharide hydrolase